MPETLNFPMTVADKAIVKDLHLFITYCQDDSQEHRELYLAIIKAIDPLIDDIIHFGQNALQRLDA